MKIAFLSLVFCSAVADFLGPDLDLPAEFCSRIPGCCEEDCCGPGTSYNGGGGACEADPSSPGWPGVYSDLYQFGCVFRRCCEDECCSEGTEYDPSIECCVISANFTQEQEVQTRPPTAAPSRTSGPTSTPGPTSIVEECVVLIFGHPCLCEDKEYDFEAWGLPGVGANGQAGTYQWTSSDDNKVEFDDDTKQKPKVKALAPSAAADDVTLTVVYKVDDAECQATFDLTVLNVELELRFAGNLSPENDVGPFPTIGMPKPPMLGAVQPGTPPGCTGFHKNIEISATVTPCVALPKCKFNFKREKQGYGGFIDNIGGGSFAQQVSEPFNVAGTWDDDDSSNVDEDLNLEVAEGCKLFVIDAPGIRNVGATCTAAEHLDQWYNFKNFREWLNVNDEQCTDFLAWRASTYIQCVQTAAGPPATYAWQEVALAVVPPFNANDVGGFDFTAAQPPPGAADPGRRAMTEITLPGAVGLVS